MDKVLIIDDSAFARSKTRRIFEKNGYAVIEADSGEKGLELVKQENPDLVTLDLLMPGLSGMETLMKLKTLSPDLKVIVVTADIQDKTREEMENAGVAAFLNKPLNEAELLNTIQKIVGKKS